MFNDIIVVGPLEKRRASEICGRIWFDIFDGLPVDISIFLMRGRVIFVPEKPLRVPSSKGFDAFNTRLSNIFPKSTYHCDTQVRK